MTDRSHPLISQASMEAFFLDLVRDATIGVGVDLSEDSEHYLVQLLASRVRRDRLDVVPFAMLWDRALQASPAEKLSGFRELGDSALFVGGFFQDSLPKRHVSRSYVADMGAMAYGSLAGLLRQMASGRQHCEMYDELAEQFDSLLDVLGEVSDSQTFDPHEDAMRLYERWLETGCQRLARQLMARGLTVGFAAPVQ